MVMAALAAKAAGFFSGMRCGRAAECGGRPSRAKPKDRSANGTSASIGQVAAQDDLLPLFDFALEMWCH